MSRLFESCGRCGLGVAKSALNDFPAMACSTSIYNEPQLVRDYEDPREVNLQLEQMSVGQLFHGMLPWEDHLATLLICQKQSPLRRDSVNRRGYNIGIRLVDEFCAKNRGARCRTFKESMETVARVRRQTSRPWRRRSVMMLHAE